MKFKIESEKLSVYILVLLSTIDKLNVVLMGNTIRISYILALPFLFFVNYKFSIFEYIFIFTFVASLLISAASNSVFFSGIEYSMWSIFLFFVFYNTTLKFCRVNKLDFPLIISNCSRLLIMIGILKYFLTDDERLNALFYEPSYMSIFLMPYACFSVVLDNPYKLFDYLLLSAYIFLSKSAAFFVVFVVLILYFLIKISRTSNLLILTTLVYIYYMTLDVGDINFLILNSIFQLEFDKLWDFIIARPGERVDNLLLTMNLAFNNIWLGMGPKSFQALMDPPTPPVNIFFSCIVEGGILQLLLILIFIIRTFKLLTFKANTYNLPFLLSLISIIIVMQIESTILRAYFWVFIGGIYGSIESLHYPFKANKSYISNHFLLFKNHG